MRTGIYGGTFAPPHIGHIRAAAAFVDSLKLDELLVIPAFIPPHKQIDISDEPQKRIDMCKIAFSHIEKAEISTIEIERGGKSYTSDTLETLSGDGRELFFLMGTDMALTLGEWHLPEIIFKLCAPVCVRREDDVETTVALEAKNREYIEKFGKGLIFLDVPVVDISSTEIRDAVKSGRSIDGYVTAGVRDYIYEKGLYK